MKFDYLDIRLVGEMCHPFAVAHFDNEGEHIPPFQNYKEALLDSALNTPRQTFGGKDLYPRIEQKAAVLFYSMIQNHPFENGNKRLGTATMLVFLFINNHWLTATQEELAEWALKIAKSGEQSFPIKKEDLMPQLVGWISNHLIILNNQ